MLLSYFWLIPSHVSENTKLISTCVEKPIPCQWAHKRYHNIAWPNITHASKDSKYSSTWIDQNPSMKARTQNAWQHVLTKPLPCQRGQKMHLNMCWRNPSLISEDRKCISSCVVQTFPMLAKTKKASQNDEIPFFFHRCHYSICWETICCLALMGWIW